MDWRTSGDTTLDAFAASLPGNSVLKTRGEVATVYDAVRPYSRFFRGVLEAESSGGTDFNAVPASMNNPVNMRIRGQEPFQQFPTLAACAIEWKSRITSQSYAYKNTQTIADFVSVYAPSSDNNDEAAYVRTVERVINSLPLLEDQPMATYSVAGLAQPIVLPVPLIVDLIPRTQTNQRPGISRQKPGYWVQHETGNPSPGADAAMHNRWLHNGADGSKLSFHFVVDDHQIYQMIPVDEVTWQAADGGGPGNMSGISCELCINQGINTAKARANAEALAGGVLKALGMSVDRVKRHWDFNAGSGDRHHCPDQMMSSGYWPTFVANVGEVIATSTPSATTTPAPPKPASIYPKGMTLELSRIAFGELVTSFGDFHFDPDGPISREWLARIAAQLKPGDDYTKAKYGHIERVTRRGKDKVRWDVYFSDGTTIPYDSVKRQVIK